MCISLIFKTLVACLWILWNHFCLILSFVGVGSKVHTFEVTHFWINVFKADEFLARLAFEFCKIGRKQMIRIACPMIAVQLTLFSSDCVLIEFRGSSARVWVQFEFE